MTYMAKDLASHMPAPGIYQHYKGGYYELMHIARHSETGELMAVYRNLYHRDAYPTDEPREDDLPIHFGQVNVRPLAMWDEDVLWDARNGEAGHGARVDIHGSTGQRGPRFRMIGHTPWKS